jgi:hypothetical protein
MAGGSEAVCQVRKAADLEGWLTQRDTLDLCVWEGDAQVIDGEHAVKWLNEELDLKQPSVLLSSERRLLRVQGVWGWPY